MHSFFNKGNIGNDITRLNGIFVTHIEFLNKLHKLLVLTSCPEIESIIRSILKDTNDIDEVIQIKGPGTLKALIIYKDCITAIYDILPWTILEFETLHVVHGLHQRSIITGKNVIHGGNIDLGCSWCQGHQFQ